MKHKIEIEVEHTGKTANMQLYACIGQLICVDPVLRSRAATMIRAFGFISHVGGCHVSIEQDGTRLAVVTSTAPDFS